jgi:predicted anti-sigma-YlaC factor YlaD
MTCDIVREATKKVLGDIENAKGSEKSHILRHIRSCPDCRKSMSREERDNVVTAIVNSFE